MFKLYTFSKLPYMLWLKNALLLTCIILLPNLGNAQCKAGFTYTVNQGEVTFKNTSSTNSGYALRYSWNFGNSQYNYSYIDSFKWQYYDSDTYTVSLFVWDSATSCRDTFTDEVIVSVPDVCDADFTFNSYSNYPAASFSAKVKSYNPSFVYIWNFGDGITDSSNGSQYHTYDNGGTYNVCLTIWNKKTGCLDTMCKSVVIATVTKTPCHADFSYNTQNPEVEFTAMSDCYGVNIWDFGDGNTSTERNPKHTFAKTGTYTVTYISKGDALHTVDTVVKSVQVYYGYCGADFMLYQGQNEFANQVYVKFFRNPSTKFKLDFGDGTIYTQPDSTRSDSVFYHYYLKGGNYNICLIKSDTAYNCTDTVCKSVQTIDPVFCYAGFKTDINHVERHVFFNSDSAFIGLHSSVFTWQFGDGSADVSGMGYYNTSHRYTKNGTYKTRLIVTNTSFSCSDTVEKEIVINKPIYKAPIIAYSDYNADSFIVYLIKYDENDSTLNAIDTGYLGTEVDTGMAGRYCIFDSLPPGRYWVKSAATKNSSWYKDHLPTYADTTLFWERARAIVLDGESKEPKYASAFLKQGNNPGGPGFIGGKVSAGANKREGDALKDIQVMLLDENRNPVTHTYSNADGSFKFENIAYGTYEVYTEVIGSKTNPATATISASNPKVENVEVKVSPKVIITSIKTKPGEIFIAQPKLYPNPTQNILYLETDLRKSQNTKLVICNVIGQEVYSENMSLNHGNQTHMIKTEKLPAGAYILMLKNASGESEMQAKFMKY